MLPVPLLFPRLPDLSGLGRIGPGGSSTGLGSVSWKAEGSGSGRRLRIREAKDSFEASVLKSLAVGGMMVGNCASLDGVDAGGGVGGRWRKKGIFRGDSAGESVVLGDSTSSSIAFAAVASPVLLLCRESSLEGLFGLVDAAIPAVLLLLDSSAVARAPLVAALSDEADADTEDSSVLLLTCGDNGRPAVGARFCCDFTDEDSMLVTDEDSLG